jgi:hypothetical protein
VSRPADNAPNRRPPAEPAGSPQSTGPVEPPRAPSEPTGGQRNQGRAVEQTDPIYLPLTSDEAVSHMWRGTREQSREQLREQIREH